MNGVEIIWLEKSIKHEITVPIQNFSFMVLWRAGDTSRKKIQLGFLHVLSVCFRKVWTQDADHKTSCTVKQQLPLLVFSSIGNQAGGRASKQADIFQEKQPHGTSQLLGLPTSLLYLFSVFCLSYLSAVPGTCERETGSSSQRNHLHSRSQAQYQSFCNKAMWWILELGWN